MSISVHHEILEQSVDGVHSYTQFVNLNVDNNTMLCCTVYYISNFMSHDSSCIEIEVYNNGKTHRLLKSVFFIYECAGILLTSLYITQLMLVTPTLIGTSSMNIINI